MLHVDDLTLNDYLDSALTTEHRADIEAHLTSCLACAARLAEQRALFAALATLPDEPLERDLTRPVLTVLRPYRTTLPVVVRWALVIQGGLALVFMLVAVLVLFYTITPPDSFINPAVDSLTHVTESLTARWQATWESAQIVITSTRDSAQAFFPKSFEWTWFAGLVAVLLLWVTGNGVILRRLIFSPPRSHS